MDVNGMNKTQNYLKLYNNWNMDVYKANASNYSNSDNQAKVNKSDDMAQGKNDLLKKDEKEKQTKKELDKAMETLNKFFQDEKTHVEYSIHKDLDRLMIKVVEDDNKEVVLEIPSKKILDMVASMCKEAGLIDEKA